ncbi:cysteine desulfurase family protein, VC1184 subfamily [Nocardioides alpinus]|uniref:Cysteine desulfurase family protein, VC1184 subfamily n=1 Tax=Nocardioides alpinus TaxID=748909 RepID=A0A1I1A2B3_9ACTN|nr:cysteine desulfurase-like protein [Nocardioides alpinus]PKH42183.1 cysteine desulfurase-like protein [Nocardioides alpinus]SFB31662.1 cysteine desulfurase family protein, VC1184 subfamily [Nocardioides alpinus]
MSFDVAAFRAHFPSLASGIAHFDNPGGTQTPAVVGDAIARTLTGPLSQRGANLVSQRNAEHVVGEFRSAVADLVGGVPGGVVHGRSATQLTYDFSRTLARRWSAGDEIVLCQLDHDSNVRPWVQAAERAGVTVRWLRLDPATGELDLSSLDAITGRTRLVALTAASNLLGTRPPVATVAASAHEVGALVYVDGVHHAAHAAPDLAAMGADLMVCSPYKFFGPHCAALVADPALLETLRPDKLLPSTDVVPERFELGTLPYEMLAGVTAAIDLIASVAPSGGSRRERLVAAYALIGEHELRLRGRIEEGLADLGGQGRLALHSRAADRTSTLFLTLRDRLAVEAYDALAKRHVLVPAGTFYAYETFRALGLPVDSGLRIGLAAYTDDAEVDRLLEGLTDFVG